MVEIFLKSPNVWLILPKNGFDHWGRAEARHFGERSLEQFSYHLKHALEGKLDLFKIGRRSPDQFVLPQHRGLFRVKN